MTEAQKIIKYLALALAIFLIVAIFGGILTSLSFISVVFTGNETVEVSQLSDYQLKDVERLYIDLEAAELEIKSGTSLSLQSNYEYLKVEESSNSLSIKETKRPWKLNDRGYKIVLTVPQSVTFASVTLNTGAGKVTLSDLNTKALNLSLGAGEVTLNNVTVTDKTEFDGGAGEITVNNCSFTDLDMQIGVGECSLVATVLGDSEIDCGVGEADLTFIRNSTIDYSISVDKGLGDVKIDGESVKDGFETGFGENEIDIHCGVGEVDIEFVNR
ncbi:MAG: DUF4097 family beta strand repeat protein [Ruminococcus sp.]|nr:DUF4097 family beta strand repeat protein [Ruminococcus sp.]